jgi:hypothetical protein
MLQEEISKRRQIRNRLRNRACESRNASVIITITIKIFTQLDQLPK